MKQARSMTAQSHRQWLINKDRDEPDTQAVILQTSSVPWTNQSINELSLEYAYETTAPERKARLSSYGSILDRYTRAMNVKRVKHPQLYQTTIEAQQSHKRHNSTETPQDIIKPNIKPITIPINKSSTKHSSICITECSPNGTKVSHTTSIILPTSVEADSKPVHQHIIRTTNPSLPNNFQRSRSEAHTSHSHRRKVASTVHTEPSAHNSSEQAEVSLEDRRLMLALEDRLQLAHAIAPTTSSTLHALRPRFQYSHPPIHLPLPHHRKNLDSTELKAEHERNQKDRLRQLASMTSSLQESRDAFSHTASTIIANQKKLIQRDKPRHKKNGHTNSKADRSIYRGQRDSSSTQEDDSSDDDTTTTSNLNYTDPSLIAQIIREPSTKLFSSTLQRSLERSKRSSSIQQQAQIPRASDLATVHQNYQQQPLVPSTTSSIQVVESATVPTHSIAATHKSNPRSSVEKLTTMTGNFLGDRASQNQKRQLSQSHTSGSQYSDPSTIGKHHVGLTNGRDLALMNNVFEESKETVTEMPHLSAQQRLVQIEARLAAQAKRSISRVRFSEEPDEH